MTLQSISDHTLNGFAAFFGGVPLLGGIIMWIRSSGAKKVREEHRLKALEDKQALHDCAIASIENGQKELQGALNRQTEVLSQNIVHQSEIFTSRLDQLIGIFVNQRERAA